MEVGTLENILGILGCLQLVRWQRLSLQELTKPQRTTHSKIELQDAQNRSKAAGGKWKSGKSSNQPTCGLFMSDPVQIP
jgi:hypothetical protein